jgi:hypothetical protein
MTTRKMNNIRKMEEKSKAEEKAEKIEIIEAELAEERKEWNLIVSKLASDIKKDLNKVMILESESISRRQELTELIGNYSYEISKALPGIKKTRKQLWEHYATKYQIKLNATEKKMFTEADLRFAEAQVEAYKHHIDFFMETRKTMDHIVWSVKNKIQLYNITEMMG